MMVKMQVLAIQLLLPFSIFGGALLIPIYIQVRVCFPGAEGTGEGRRG
jgi:hypothetical protein